VRGTSLALLLPTLLAACGDLPRPFQGNPGATALRLSRPPPPRLDVPAPGTSLLTNAGAADWAHDTADALVDQEVPAVAIPPHNGDWQLALSAATNGQTVTPRYTVLDPKGAPQGSVDGPAVPAAAWATAAPVTLQQAAQSAAPQVGALLTAIEARLQQSDPNSLLNRPARLYLAGVTGAPGDGNASLARQIRLKLPGNGNVLQDSPNGADFTIKGVVTVRNVPGGQQQIEIHWIVADIYGKEAGDVAQGHDIPAGSLDGYWGEVASVVADEAAGGIGQVINNWTGRHRPPASEPVASK